MIKSSVYTVALHNFWKGCVIRDGKQEKYVSSTDGRKNQTGIGMLSVLLNAPLMKIRLDFISPFFISPTLG